MKKALTLCLLIGLSFVANAQKQYTLSYESGKKAVEGKWTYTVPLPAALNTISGSLKRLESTVLYDVPEDRSYGFQQSQFGLMFEGLVTFWYPNGKLWRKATYKNGALNGPYVKYYPSGERYSKGNFVNGMMDGEWNYYYRDGKPKMQIHTTAYTQEQLDKGIRTHTLKPERGGKTLRHPDDARMELIRNMVLFMVSAYTDWLPENSVCSGQQLFWDMQGKQEAVLNYKEWTPDGPWTVYKDGKKLVEAVFRKDSLVALHDGDGKDVLQNSGFTPEDVRELYHPDRRKVVTEVVGPVTEVGDVSGIDPATATGTLAEASSAPMVYTYVEQMPQFPGDVNAYIEKNLKYPQKEKELGVEERISVNFVVNIDGSIGKATIVRGNNEAFQKEAIRLIEHMPKWTPGRQNGVAVAVSYTLPVIFKLK